MTLELPSDLEPWLDDYDDLHRAGAYALRLARPPDPEAAWARHYEETPPWWGDFLAAESVIYVGATGDVLSRLEDHRDGEVRQASILRVCEIEGLHTVWWADDYEQATVREYNLAAMLERERPDAYVHSK